jgi:hypothetical protein
MTTDPTPNPTRTAGELEMIVDLTRLTNPIGLVLTADNGQRYEVIDLEPHTRLDGTLTTLAVWKSHCNTCGCEFVTRSPVIVTQMLSRRCQEHKRPGSKAMSEIRAKARRQAEAAE